MDIDKFSSQHCNMVYFRMGVHVAIIPHEQIRRDNHARLSELFLENEQDRDPVVVRVEERCSGESLTDGQCTKPSIARGATQGHAHRKSACHLRLRASAQAQVRWIPPVLQKHGKRRPQQSCTVPTARTEATLEGRR